MTERRVGSLYIPGAVVRARGCLYSSPGFARCVGGSTRRSGLAERGDRDAAAAQSGGERSEGLDRCPVDQNVMYANEG